jgi:hypothetical protein
MGTRCHTATVAEALGLSWGRVASMVQPGMVRYLPRCAAFLAGVVRERFAGQTDDGSFWHICQKLTRRSPSRSAARADSAKPIPAPQPQAVSAPRPTLADAPPTMADAPPTMAAKGGARREQRERRQPISPLNLPESPIPTDNGKSPEIAALPPGLASSQAMDSRSVSSGLTTTGRDDPGMARTASGPARGTSRGGRRTGPQRATCR